MASSKRWEWDKQGDLDGHARFDDELPSSVTLSDPSVELHQRTSTEGVKPEVWVDRSSEVTIAVTIVAARDDDWVLITGGTGRAARVVITADTDSQPDFEDEPEPATDYRIKITATRSDSSRPIAREVPLTILP